MKLKGMKGGRFSVWMLCVFYVGCQSNPNASPKAHLELSSSSSKVGQRLFFDDMSDSLWIQQTYALWWSTLMDTTSRPRTVIGSRNEWGLRSFRRQTCPKSPCYLGYTNFAKGMSVSYLLSDGQAIHAMWYDNELIYTAQYCFNDAWGACGMGFQREVVYRRSMVIDERLNFGEQTKEEFESHLCNCIAPLAWDTLMDMRKRCLSHHDAY